MTAAKDSSNRIRTTLYTWVRGFWHDVMGPTGYRGLAVIVAGYVGLYSIIEARHERQLNFAATERNVFITMVSSGERGSFIAAMKNFGPIQSVAVFDEPSLFEPWNWWRKAQPNLGPLHSWAQHRLKLCTRDECGQPEGYRLDLQDANLTGSKLARVDLDDSDLRFAEMPGANLHRAYLKKANLACANLRGADLTEAKLEGADLKLVNLARADLEGANLRDAQIEGFNPIALIANRTLVADGKTHQSSFGGVPFEATPCGRSNRNGLTAAEFKYADLRGVKGLGCERLKQARNWHLACRDRELACGEEIPEPGSRRCPIIESEETESSDDGWSEEGD